ncbi:hypothetical protein ACFCXP_11255 [Streptomyces niveus]|uniref:hypothetical protein n=1 Tax=Streptomyces niveus TaxID=193462 RepID=UPI0035D7FC05
MTTTPTAGPTPRTAALSLIRSTALHEAAHRRAGAEEPPPPDWEMYTALTATLTTWRRSRGLRHDAARLTEWLAVHLIAYRIQDLGDQSRLESWVCDFGDEVSRAQQHAHPAGPTAVEILSVVVADPYAQPGSPGGAQRLAAINRATWRYLRFRKEVEDARELALTVGLWAGAQLSAIMNHDIDRITAYLDEHDARGLSQAEARNEATQDGSPPMT